MRILSVLTAICLFSCLTMISCVKDGSAGGTISSQVAGTFMSTDATVIVDNDVVVDASEDFMLEIIEVDANTVSVISEHTKAFEVNLEKSDNGTFNTGTTNSGGSGFLFSYHVAEGIVTINYTNDDVTMNYIGEKE